MERSNFELNKETGTLSEFDAKRYFSTFGFAIFAYVVISFISANAIAMLFQAYAPELLEIPAVTYLISIVGQYGIGLLPFLLIVSRLPRRTNTSRPFGVGRTVGGFCVAIALMSAGSTIGQFVILLLEMLTKNTLLNPVEKATANTHWAINLIFIAIVMPVIEELVFRKIICDRLLPLGEGYAIVLSALIFGLIHGNFYQFFYGFFLGLLFAFIYVKTGRVRYSIGYHVLINFLGGVLLPWINGVLEPIMTEEMLERMTGVLESGSVEAMEAMAAELSKYMVPMLLFMGYELLFYVASIVGIITLMINLKKVKFKAGVLPPPKKGRIANIFLNAGVAAAVTAFAGTFILSLL